jgi:hypothetical protein
MERIGNRYGDRCIIFLADREVDRFDVDNKDDLPSLFAPSCLRVSDRFRRARSREEHEE